MPDILNNNFMAIHVFGHSWKITVWQISAFPEFNKNSKCLVSHLFCRKLTLPRRQSWKCILPCFFFSFSLWSLGTDRFLDRTHDRTHGRDKQQEINNNDRGTSWSGRYWHSQIRSNVPISLPTVLRLLRCFVSSPITQNMGGWGDKCRLLSALLLSECFKISDEYSTFFRFFENFSFWNVFQISKLFIFWKFWNFFNFFSLTSFKIC